MPMHFKVAVTMLGVVEKINTTAILQWAVEHKIIALKNFCFLYYISGKNKKRKFMRSCIRKFLFSSHKNGISGLGDKLWIFRAQWRNEGGGGREFSLLWRKEKIGLKNPLKWSIGKLKNSGKIFFLQKKPIFWAKAFKIGHFVKFYRKKVV